MKKFFVNDLLPEGFKVLLPDDAHKEESISRIILDLYFSNGYLLVKTPMMEYEDNVSKNTLKLLNNNSFLLMEPETKKILTLRSDITPQVAKIASTKLKHYNRPLRLAYSGEVIRNSKNSYQADRQFKQIGAEIIGGNSIYGLIEILYLTTNALSKLEIKNITIDFSLPEISRLIDKKLKLNKKNNKSIKDALDNKDSSIVKGKKFSYINGLIALSGPVEKAKTNFKNYNFPKPISLILADFFKLSSKLKKVFPNLSITLDITEGKSFLEYHNFGFKIYNKDNANPVALGGDYRSNNNEFGLGISFLVNKIITSVTMLKKEKVYVPYNVSHHNNKIKKSYILIKELFDKKNHLIEAKKQNCNYVLNKNGTLKKVK